MIAARGRLQKELQCELWLMDALLTDKDPRLGRQRSGVSIRDFFMGRAYSLSGNGASHLYYIDDEIELNQGAEESIKERWGTGPILSVKARAERVLMFYRNLLSHQES